MVNRQTQVQQIALPEQALWIDSFSRPRSKGLARPGDLKASSTSGLDERSSGIPEGVACGSVLMVIHFRVQKYMCGGKVVKMV